MKNCIIAMICAAGPAVAQDLYTVQPCTTPVNAITIAELYDETPLFTMYAVQTHISGTEFTTQMLFQVNQTTGTWSLLSVPEDGVVCLVALGNDFAPYTK